MPFWSRKSPDDRALSQSIVKQQRATRQACKGVAQTSGMSDRLATVIALLQDQPDWDYAMTQTTAREAALYAASFIGFEAPFDAEEDALLTYLSEHFAGRKIATFAWGLYADQLREQSAAE